MIRFLIAALLALLASSGARAQTPCDALARTDFSRLPDAPTVITSAAVVPASGDLPAYCRVEGTVAPQVGFEVRLPMTGWNGKYLQQGCGGMCGWINMGACEDALARTYAVANTDMGHKGSPASALWALDNRSAEIDFAYRATYVTSIAAKAIVSAFYGAAPARSYFRGCSTGGRQGLILAQRFPHAFDGIIAGAPVYNQGGVGVLHLLWSGRASVDAAGAPVLTADKVALLHRAVMASCDRLDGLADGILQDPTACRFEPRQLACTGAAAPDCLTQPEIAAVEKIYRGAHRSDGRALIAAGMPKGSEYQWAPAFVAPAGGQPFVLNPQGLIGDILRYLNLWDDPAAGPGPLAFDFDRDTGRLALMEPLFNAQNPDLRAFKARGGKLILWHGWDDLEIPAAMSLDYWRTMERTMGGPEATRSFARLFLLPGVAHCRRGVGPDAFDELAALEAWVERGAAPDVITAHKLVKEQTYLGLPRPRFPLPAADVAWTRPVPAHPLVARHTGRGDPAQASSWRFEPMAQP